ncbi:hypothetical protein QR680_014726 [Steinernema hermaphroditum]|uniref:dolichol kinase n=1 Tax=Steinernema hermaphroditum TaxID=289476 RepID=A0AA39I9X8_9BILA|nr:hypothetical protein QR680_014726 [Steinernema hermaphroditum]
MRRPPLLASLLLSLGSSKANVPAGWRPIGDAEDEDGRIFAERRFLSTESPWQENGMPPATSELLDRPLIQSALLATATFVLVSPQLRHQPVLINLLLAVVVLVAVLLFAWRVAVSPEQVPLLLLYRVYDGTAGRWCLLMFWAMCMFASVIFCVMVRVKNRSSTVHRKFFHLTISLIAVSGLRHDPDFVLLSALLMACIFVILEVLRSAKVPPWHEKLDDWLLVFLDAQDSRERILTPIFLIIGIFLPIFLSPPGTDHVAHAYHYAGVITVGIGDSFAALVGSQFGSHHWKRSKKTIEGSVAMWLSQIAGVYLLCPIGEISFLWTVVVCGLSAALEAGLRKGDNVILPFFCYLLL